MYVSCRRDHDPVARSEICFDSDASAPPYVPIYFVWVCTVFEAAEGKATDRHMRFPLVSVCEICSSSVWWPESRIFKSHFNDVISLEQGLFP